MCKKITVYPYKLYLIINIYFCNLNDKYIYIYIINQEFFDVQLQGVSSLGPFPTARKAPSPKWDVPTSAPPVDNLDIRYIRPLWPLGPPSFSFGMGWLEGNSRFHMRMWTFVVCICLCVYLVLLWFHPRRNRAKFLGQPVWTSYSSKIRVIKPWGHDNAPHPETTNLGSSWSCFQNWACWWINHLDLSWVFLLKKCPARIFHKNNHHFSTANKHLHHDSRCPHLPGVGKTRGWVSPTPATASRLHPLRQRPQFHVPSEPHLGIKTGSQSKAATPTSVMW